MSDETKTECVSWVKLYHARGCDVRIALPYPAEELFARVEALFAQGWLVTAPGLEEGERRASVGYVVHGESERDKEITPFLLLYDDEDAHSFSFLKVYLNRPEDVTAFEFASKMRLADVPVYIGNDKPERGKSSKVDRFIVKAPKPFSVVFKTNPKFDETAAKDCRAKGEIYKVPSRLFVRWADQKPGAAQQAEAPVANNLDALAKQWTNWIDECGVDVDKFNDILRDLPSKEASEKKLIWGLMLEYARRQSWEFNRERKVFLALVPSSEPY